MKSWFVLIYLSAILLQGCFSKKNWQATYIPQNKTTIPIQTIYTDSTLPELITYKQKLDQAMNVVIGNNTQKLEKTKPNPTLGHMVCDAMLAKAKSINANTVAAICNYGGIRIPTLMPGDITLGKVYEVMPFDNTLCLVTLNGAALDSVCQQIAESGGAPIAGINFIIKNKKAIDITINGEAINNNTSYCVVINDYMANGGDKFDIFKSKPIQTTTILVRDAIIEHIKLCNKNNSNLLLQASTRIKE
jgi:2',3'-cyclic-nucleotide 2'-phosphodiesterase (5'-nucleotidase family)